MGMEKPIRVAVIGLGLSARVFHLPFLQTLPDYHWVAVSTSQTLPLPWQTPDLAQFASAEALLTALAGDLEADLVVITAPNAQHFELAQAALQLGKHVVVEKPFVNTVAEGETLIALAKQKQCLLSVFHNRRWDGDFLTVKQLIENQTLGDLKLFVSHFDRFRPDVQDRWRERPGPGAGSWFDLGSHLLDQALCLFGEPLEITGMVRPMRAGAEVPDTFHVSLHYPTHAVILNGSPFVAGPKLRFDIQGTRGRYLKYGLDPQEERLKGGILPTTPDWAAEDPLQFGHLYFDSGSEVCPTLTGGYGHYYGALAAAIRGKGELPVSPESALAVIRLLEIVEKGSFF